MISNASTNAAEPYQGCSSIISEPAFTAGSVSANFFASSIVSTLKIKIPLYPAYLKMPGNNQFSFVGKLQNVF